MASAAIASRTGTLAGLSRSYEESKTAAYEFSHLFLDLLAYPPASGDIDHPVCYQRDLPQQYGVSTNLWRKFFLVDFSLLCLLAWYGDKKR